MDKAEMIYIASKCAEKSYDYETLRYGNDMYENPQFTDDVWEYVVEYKEIGSIDFRKKYKEFELY